MKIPSREGKEGVSLQGWVLPFGTTHPDTPPMEGNPIFMLNGAAQAAWRTPMKIPSREGKEGVSLQGWVLPFGTTHPDTPPNGGESHFHAQWRRRRRHGELL